MVSTFGSQEAAEQPSGRESAEAAAASPWKQLDLSDLILPKLPGGLHLSRHAKNLWAQRFRDLTKWRIMLILV